MNRRTVLAWLPCLAASPALVAAMPDATAAARAAGRQWLQLLDAADHAGTWAAAATVFKSAVSAAAWQQAAQSVRGPLGAVRSRQDKSATLTRSLPGVPDGQYVVLQFDTAFEHRADAVETVTLALEPDDRWRVAGYFIR